MIKTIRNVMIVVPVLITSCHVSEKLNMGPVTNHMITITQAIINAAGLPEALVIFVAILSKKYRKVFLFTVFTTTSCLFIRCSFYGLKVEKLRPNNFFNLPNEQNDVARLQAENLLIYPYFCTRLSHRFMAQTTQTTQTTKPLTTIFSKETYLYWYELMQLIRQFEMMAEEKYKMEGKIRGFFHAYIGQEAIAAGCMTATRPEDLFITAYRDHGLAISKGVSVNSCMAELYGKATGNAKGKGGSMHFFGKSVNFYGGHGIVGAQIGTGAGLAFAEQYRGTDNIVLCFFGDGAARQGMLHETFNL